MSWGYRIVTAYVAFVAFMLVLVGLCMSQKDIFLVEKEYYKEELAYQAKIDKLNAAARLKAPVAFQIKGGILEIAYPAGAHPTGGQLWLFRPANATLDRRLPAQAEAGVQRIPLAGMAPGLWRIKLDWHSQGKTYFFEDALNVPSL